MIEGIKEVKINFYPTTKISDILNMIQGYPSLMINWEALNIPSEVIIPNYLNGNSTNFYRLKFLTELSSEIYKSLCIEGDPLWYGDCDFFWESFQTSYGIIVQSHNKRLKVVIDYNWSTITFVLETPSLTHKDWLEEIARVYKGECLYEEYEQ